VLHAQINYEKVQATPEGRSNNKIPKWSLGPKIRDSDLNENGQKGQKGEIVQVESAKGLFDLKRKRVVKPQTRGKAE